MTKITLASFTEAEYGFVLGGPLVRDVTLEIALAKLMELSR